MLEKHEVPEDSEVLEDPEVPEKKRKSNNYDKNLQNYGLYFGEKRKKAINMMGNAKIIALEI